MPKPTYPDRVGVSPEEVPDLIVQPRPAPVSQKRAAFGSSMSVTLPATGDFELELEPTNGAAPPMTSPPLFGGSTLDSELVLFDEAGGAAADLDLGFDLEPAAPTGPAPATASARASDVPWPVGTTPHPDELAVDLDEVRRLAAFGKPPRSFLSAPPYALRVALRLRALRALEQQKKAALLHAETARDDVLVALARSCRAQLEANDRYGSLAGEFRAHERRVEEHVAALEEADAGLHAAESDIGAQLVAVEHERAVAHRQVQRHESEFAELETQLERLTAQSKRLDIERRALLDVARRKLGPQGGELPPDVTGPLEQIEARAAALAPKLEEQRQRVAEGKARLLEARRNLERIDGQIRSLTAKKSMTLAERQAERESRAQALADARAAERAALTGVARAVLGMKGHIPVSEDTLATLREHDARVREAAYELETARLALRAYDENAVRQGCIVAAIVLLLVVGAMVL